MYAQPLYVGQVAVPNGGTHNLVFIATQHNSVYAYDADAVAPPVLLWHVNLGPSVPSSTFADDYLDIYPEVGILSTGTIDRAGGVLYVVADTLRNGSPAFQLHALDLATGSERMKGPTTIAASVAGTGAASLPDGTLPFAPAAHIQRPGLLLLNGGVYIAFGSHGDEGLWHGWVMRYNAADLSQAPAAFNASPNGLGASIWQSGRGLAADGAGSIYAVAGNGDFDGVQNFGESFLKLSPNLSLLDWYTPANQQYLSDSDYDLSAGAALIPGTHMLVGGDKNGDLYLVNGDSMGHLDTAGTAQVFPAVSYFGIYTFALWNRTGGTYLYLQPRAGPLMAYQYSGGAFRTTPVSSSTASPDSPFSGVAISANGTQEGTGILWETTGSYEQLNPAGTLHAFDAGNLGTELWNSDINPAADTLGAFAKFATPTVANGKVYVPTFSNLVAVYGLLASGPQDGNPPPTVAAVSNAASYDQDGVAPGELVTLFGINLGPSDPAGLQLDPSGRVSTSLGQTLVLFDGVAAPMVYAGPNQVSAVVPFGVAGPVTQVRVQYQNQTSTALSVNVRAAAPGIFSTDSSGSGQALVLNQNGSLNSADTPAPTGSVMVFYATGGGQTSPAGMDGAVTGSDSLPFPNLPVSVLLGGKTANVLYAGSAPGMVQGVLQINVQVPDDAVTGPTVPIVLQIGDQLSQPSLTVAIGN